MGNITLFDYGGYKIRIVKEETGGESVAGSFGCYILELSSAARLQLTGHLGMKKVLDSPHVDFLSSPTMYPYRQLGKGTQEMLDHQRHLGFCAVCAENAHPNASSQRLVPYCSSAGRIRTLAVHAASYFS